MEVSLFWSIISAVTVVAVSYGGLLMREQANRNRISELKADTDDQLDKIRHDLQHLAESQAEHREETTDRLARMETTLNLVARKVLNGD